MPNDEVIFSSDYLEILAGKQDLAKDKANSSAGAANGIGKAVWISHCVFSGWSCGAMEGVEPTRKAAGEAMRDASNELAAKLRATKVTYTSVDEDEAANLSKQVRDA